MWCSLTFKHKYFTTFSYKQKYVDSEKLKHTFSVQCESQAKK